MSAYAQQLNALHNAIVRNESGAVLPFIKSQAKEEQLAVYADGYVDRLVGATIADYPALAYYMGEADCKNAITDFVKTHPSFDWDLNQYPVRFADFIKQDAATRALALLEATIVEMFWLPDSEPLNPGPLADLNEEQFGQLRFQFRTASRLLKLDHAANAYLSAFREGKALSEMETKSEYIAVVRHDNEVQRIVLDAVAFQLLTRLHEGNNFNDALAGFDADTLAGSLPGYLAKWLNAGIFSKAYETAA